MRDIIVIRTKGPYTYTAYTEYDTDPDLSWLETDNPQDHERLNAYHRGDWHMVGVVCEITVKTKTNWVHDPIMGRTSIWGVESDSEKSYLLELAEEQMLEAEHDLNNLKKALQVHP